MASTDYQYDPLTSESSFRVLRLLPATSGVDQSTAIEIELSEANLDSPPEYEAISYAWGQEEANASIVCNGRYLLVTPTVISVLQKLRVTGSSRVLWLDSICIDQTSIPEKNIQVPRMRSIYRQATRVWVWLGNGSHEVDVTFEYLTEMNEIMEGEDLDGDLTNELMVRSIQIFHGE
jgi:hypothetical protein